MSEVALYRKYRSQSFDAVIGQPHVVTTLQNAIAHDRLSHAYLFTGPRGTGKTSVARLLARAANCTSKDPATRPCGTCDNCKVEIGSHLDLIEIDAASNRGIDDARALREKITSAPSMGRYKVYIIDEVHMLTTEAFNALLKTLEEPPAHALFILATTEAHKLPETIVSRTQRFSFKPIQNEDIVRHLAEIAKEEQVIIDTPALELIATISRGGFRDAISLLDQVGSSGRGKLDLATVQELLGQSDGELLDKIMQQVLSQEPMGVLTALDQAWEMGIQPAQLAAQLTQRWRKQLRLALAEEQGAEAVEVALGAVEALIPVTRSPWPELALESALVRVASGSVAPSVSAAPTPRAAPTPAKPATSTVKPAPTDSKPAPPPPSGQPNGDLWIKVLTQIKQKNNSLYALLRSSCSVHFEGNEVMLGCRFTFHRDRLKETKNMQVIEQALTRVYGQKFRVLPQIETNPKATADPSSELMSSALEILGGEVVQ